MTKKNFLERKETLEKANKSYKEKIDQMMAQREALGKEIEKYVRQWNANATVILECDKWIMEIDKKEKKDKEKPSPEKKK